jgi:hypothetical protein
MDPRHERSPMLTRKLAAPPDPSAFLISFFLRFRHLRRLHSQWNLGRVLEFDFSLHQALAFGSEFLDLSEQTHLCRPFLVLEQHNTPRHSHRKKLENPFSHERVSWLLFLLVQVSLAPAWYTTTSWQLGRNVWLSFCPFSGKGT